MCLLISVLAVQGGPSTSSNRFLFIIDASAAMKPLEKPLSETLFDLIYSGVRGRMTNGDTYGIWLVNGQNDTSFPMETWKRQFVVELAAKAVTHMKDHGFKGKPHLELALADAQNVLKNIGDLTVILVTDGSTPIMGTPFDEAINARWQEIAPGLKRAKAPLNTALVAQDGEFVAWAANSPEFMIEIPIVAPKPKPAKVEVAATKTTTQEPMASPALNSVAAPKPRIATSPIIITKESVAQERRSYLSSTAPIETEPTVAVATNAVLDIAAAATTNIAVLIPTNTNNVTAASTVAKSSATNLPAVSAAPVAKNAEPVNLESVSIVPSQNTAGASDPSNSSVTVRTALLWAGVGAGAMLAGVIAVMILLRRNRQEPSLISQALVRERLSIH